MPAWLERPAGRFGLYAAIAGVFFLLALASCVCKSRFDFLVSDSPYYYAYLPSLLLDGDVDLTNQADCTPNLKVHLNTPKFPVGFALTLLPSFLAAHGLSVAASAMTGAAWCRPDGFTLLYQIVLLVQVMGLGLASFILLDWLLTRHLFLDGAATALGISTYWIGSNYSYYYFREPMMIHVTGAFWVAANVAATVALAARAARQNLPGWLVGLCCLTGSMAVVCRPTNAFLAPFAAWALYHIWQNGRPARLLATLPWVMVGLVPLGVQMLFWHCTAGQLIHYSYGDERFTNWSTPKLWQTLISVNHGMLLWSPVLVVSVVGLAWNGWKTRSLGPPLLRCWLVGFALLWYANSSWYGWSFGDAFGARAFLEVSGLFVIGLAYYFHHLFALRLALRLLGTALMGLAVVFNYGLMGLYITRTIPRGWI